MTTTTYRLIRIGIDQHEVWSEEGELMGSIAHDGPRSYSCYGRHGNFIASQSTRKEAVMQVTVR
jgi:hypothetical protein